MIRNCKCYVRGLSPEVQFCLRYGAHSTRCPAYRPSKDPVDQLHDEEYRRDHERYGERLNGVPANVEMLS